MAPVQLCRRCLAEHPRHYTLAPHCNPVPGYCWACGQMGYLYNLRRLHQWRIQLWRFRQRVVDSWSHRA